MTDSLAIVLPALREAQNLAGLLPQVHSVASALSVPYEVIVVTAAHDRATWDAAARARARVVLQTAPGYGEALRSGFAAASAARVLTMDADLSHEPRVIADLWRERHTADVLIASRYVEGGSAEMPLVRRALSRILNRVFARGLSLRVRDLSSGFRLYDRRLLQPEAYRARDFDILQEVLVRLYAEGWRIREVPFRYRPRVAGSSHARVLAFGLSYARTFWTLWKLRNSIASADYDDRAFDSPIPLQRYWQRKRCSEVLTLVPDKARVLDVYREHMRY